MNTHLHLVATGSPARILMVEDDSEIATMLVETFTDNGFEAVAATCASEMDATLQKQAFDLIVLDAIRRAAASSKNET